MATISQGTRVLSPKTASYRRRARKAAVMRLRRRIMLRPRAWSAIGFGALSLMLYYGLYHFHDEILYVGDMVNRGDKTYFLLPIGVAFVFSLVHGLFTDRFWEAVGLKAKR